MEIINLFGDVLMISDSCEQLLLSVLDWSNGNVLSLKYSHKGKDGKGKGEKS